MSSYVMEVQGSGSDGESSGGREVRHINSRVRHRLVQHCLLTGSHRNLRTVIHKNKCLLYFFSDGYIFCWSLTNPKFIK